MYKVSSNFSIVSFRSRGLAWLMLTVLCFSFVPSVSFAQQPTATINTLSGTVLVNGQETGKGTVLSAGDVIETQAGASVVLELSDGSLLEIDENTKLDLAVLSQTATGARTSRVKVWWGWVRAKLSPGHQAEGSKFDFETPNALAGVKFSQPDVEVSYDPAKEETVALALTVALAVKNFVTDEEKIIPIGSMAIITASGIQVVPGAVATGTIVAEAAVTIGNVQTLAEFRTPDSQEWQPLRKGLQLPVGSQIRTGDGGKVSLLCDDGSVLFLSENTSLAIRELTFSKNQQIRLIRFSLIKGTATAEVAEYDFENNLFEIEIALSAIRMNAANVSITAHDDIPWNDIIVLEGLAVIRSTAIGTMNVAGLTNENEGQGVTFTTEQENAHISLKVSRDQRKIWLSSNIPLTEATIQLGNHDNILRVNNLGEEPLLTIHEVHETILQEQSKALFSFPSDKEENQIFDMQTGVVEAIFVFKGIQKVEGKGLRVSAEQGIVVFNGQTLEVGATVIALPPEIPVIPPAPESPEPKGRPASSPMP